ncbi:MAG: hypothetical protein QXU18_10150 [Thermoplasmatales archaeon]
MIYYAKNRELGLNRISNQIILHVEHHRLKSLSSMFEYCSIHSAFQGRNGKGSHGREENDFLGKDKSTKKYTAIKERRGTYQSYPT